MNVNFRSSCFVLILISLNVASSVDLKTNQSDPSGYFAHPKGCLVGSDCEFVAKWKSPSADYVEFNIGTKLLTNVNADDFWLAIAFSNDKHMGDDSGVVCRYFRNGTYLVENIFNTGKSSALLKQDFRSVGIMDTRVHVNDGSVEFSFKRIKSQPNLTQYFDLTNEFHLLMAKGKLSQTDMMRQHSSRIVTDQKVNFNVADKVVDLASTDKSYLIKVHAAIMIFTWIFMSTMGILFARYFKFIFPKRIFFNVQFWFNIHRLVMVLVLIFSIAGLLAILAYKEWTWIDYSIKLDFSHSIIGAVVIGLAFLQLILGVLRPDKSSRIRPFFNIIHRSFGLVAYFSSIAAIISGEAIFLVKGNWSILTGWLVWLVGFCVLLEILEYKIRKNKTAPIPENGMGMEEKETYKEKEKWKSFLLCIHLVLSFTFTISLILVIIEIF